MSTLLNGESDSLAHLCQEEPSKRYIDEDTIVKGLA